MRSVENLHLNIARIRGQGKYVSTVMSIRDTLDHFGYMEGDAKFTVDSSAENYTQYTGTEDYFNGGWYFIEGAFSRNIRRSSADIIVLGCGAPANVLEKAPSMKYQPPLNNLPFLYIACMFSTVMSIR